MMMLPAVQAGDTAARLAALRQGLERQSVARPRVSGPRHRAALVSGTLGETAAALERLEGQDIDGQDTSLGPASNPTS